MAAHAHGLEVDGFGRCVIQAGSGKPTQALEIDMGFGVGVMPGHESR